MQEVPVTQLADLRSTTLAEREEKVGLGNCVFFFIIFIFYNIRTSPITRIASIYPYYAVNSSVSEAGEQETHRHRQTLAFPADPNANRPRSS